MTSALTSYAVSIARVARSTTVVIKTRPGDDELLRVTGQHEDDGRDGAAFAVRIRRPAGGRGRRAQTVVLDAATTWTIERVLQAAFDGGRLIDIVEIDGPCGPLTLFPDFEGIAIDDGDARVHVGPNEPDALRRFMLALEVARSHDRE